MRKVTFDDLVQMLEGGYVCDGIRVIEKSAHAADPTKQITTVQLSYWRPIHAELMTHRVFSRNASSSRAIPVKKVLAQVWDSPAKPVHWGLNQPGMQADEELAGWRRWAVEKLWTGLARTTCCFVWAMSKLGLHKQVANRPLEAFQRIHVVLTATDWENFFELRCHEDAQPEIYALACSIRNAIDQAPARILKPGEWHLPYITQEERNTLPVELLKRISAARCCRVSYLKHDGTQASVEEDLKLCDRLVGARPLHASPFEHQATPDKLNFGIWANPAMHGNLSGWIQHRKEIEAEHLLG